MSNYVNLPKEMKSFIKDFDYITLTANIQGHDWIRIPVDTVLSDEGVQWFADKKITLSHAVLFKIVKNFAGPIHTDAKLGSVFNAEAACAFNFVLDGHGEMQWLSNVEGKEFTFKHNDIEYSMWKDVRKFDIIDVWTGDVAFIRGDVPHRVVTTDVERYCVSLRAAKYNSINIFESNTFESIAKTFGV